MPQEREIKTRVNCANCSNFHGTECLVISSCSHEFFGKITAETGYKPASARANRISSYPHIDEFDHERTTKN